MRFSLAFMALLIGLTYGCGSSSSTPTSPTTTTTTPGGTNVSIVMGASTLTATAYNPNPVIIGVNGSVTWTNNDAIPHTSTADGGTWNSGTIASGGTFSRTFATAGTFTYHCSIHPGMVGTVTVQ